MIVDSEEKEVKRQVAAKIQKEVIPEFAHSLYQAFEREGIPLLLAGGWAVCYHGYTRYTNDVDWICSREHEAKALQLMKSLGFEIAFESMATRFVRKRQIEVLPIDLLWVSAETFAQMATTDRRTGRHQDIPVIDFETLLSMKLHALKDDDERKGKDLLDIRNLLGENRGVISEERFRGLCDKFAGPKAFNHFRNQPWT